MPVDDKYDRLGKKLDGVYIKVEPEQPEIEIYDKKGNKLQGLYKKKELSDEKDIIYE